MTADLTVAGVLAGAEWCDEHDRFHQGRENTVPCLGCGALTFEVHGVCRNCVAAAAILCAGCGEPITLDDYSTGWLAQDLIDVGWDGDGWVGNDGRSCADGDEHAPAVSAAA